MQIIDFHTHIYPPEIAEKATRSTCAYYHLDTPWVGTAETLLSRGRQAGIGQYVLLPVAMKPAQTRRVNEFVRDQAQAHPEFFAFGALHPELSDLSGELDFLLEHGFRGVKLHPDLQGFPLDDERLFPAYEALSGRLPVLFHCGDRTLDYSRPSRLLPPEQTREYIRGYGAQRVLFGSDFPLWDPVEEVRRFRELALSPREQEQIAYENARRLLGIS